MFKLMLAAYVVVMALLAGILLTGCTPETDRAVYKILQHDSIAPIVNDLEDEIKVLQDAMPRNSQLSRVTCDLSEKLNHVDHIIDDMVYRWNRYEADGERVRAHRDEVDNLWDAIDNGSLDDDETRNWKNRLTNVVDNVIADARAQARKDLKRVIYALEDVVRICNAN